MSDRLNRMYEVNHSNVSSTDPEESCDFSREYPTLFAFLTVSTYRGKVRKTGTVLAFWEDGKAKCCVKDRQEGRVAFLAGETYADMFRAVEDGMANGAIEWRSERAKGGSVVDPNFYKKR